MEARREHNDIVGDLMIKASSDVTKAILRTLAIAPEPHLPIALSAAAAALGAVAATLWRPESDEPPPKNPEPECILLAGLLAARIGIGDPDAISEAYADLELLKAKSPSPIRTPT